MRKITSGLFISLDGVVEAPETWHFPYFSDEMGTVVNSNIEASDTMLLGRNTYQAFAGFWPQQGSDVQLADHMNSVPKLVVSHTLTTADWANSTIVGGDVNAALTAMKDQPGKNIAIVGSPTLVRTLLRDGVLDELDLLVHPIVVGKGARLFPDGTEKIGLELVSSETFKSGVLRLVYRAAS
jgi:dihydrofolate reductase